MNIKFLSISMLCLSVIAAHAATVTVDNYTTQPQTIDVISSEGICTKVSIPVAPAQRNITNKLAAKCSVKEIRMFGANQEIKYADPNNNDAEKNFRVSVLETGSMIVAVVPAGERPPERIFSKTFDLDLFIKKQGYKSLTIDKETGILQFKLK